MEIQAGLHNEFDIIVRDATTGEIKKTAKAYNIILNAFWTNFTSTGKFSYIQFGSGTTTPAATDTALTSRIGGKACATDSIDTSTFLTDYTIKRKRSIRLEDTEFVGSTISEVGFAYGASSGLLTKALVKDSNGNPLSITKNANETIDIFGTFYLKAPPGSDYYFTGECGDAKILGTALSNQTSNSAAAPRFIRGDSYPRAIALFAYGESYTMNGPFAPTWDTANKRLTFTLSNMTAAIGNIGGFDSLEINGLLLKLPRSGFAQPVLTKEVIATGDGVSKDFPCAFGAILNNGTAKLYVNDVEVPATFDYNVPNIPSDGVLTGYLKLLSIVNGVTVFENPYYQKVGIKSVFGSYYNLYASSDLTNWSLVVSRSSTSKDTEIISATYQKHRYWKIEPYGAAQGASITSVAATTAVNKPIHATTAPASGSTVALTYQPNCIAKDSNHVVNNISVQVTFNEYAP